MDARKQPSRIRDVRRAIVSAGALAMCLLSGCVWSKSFTHTGEMPVSDNICQTVVVWNPRVTYTPDPARNGKPGVGLVGRVYLFGPQIDFPQVGDGGLVIDMLRDVPKEQGAEQVLVEQWRFDPATLKRLLKRDTIGWGYTLFLPWGTYSPEINRVCLKLRYEPAKGAPLYAPPTNLTLEPPLEETGPASSTAQKPAEQSKVDGVKQSGPTKPVQPSQPTTAAPTQQSPGFVTSRTGAVKAWTPSVQ